MGEHVSAKVYNLADFRPKAPDQAEAAPPVAEQPSMGNRELCLWRNLHFFAHRLREPKRFGSLKYRLVRLEDGRLMLDLDCSLYRALYLLTEELCLVPGVDALLIKWKSQRPNDYPITPRPKMKEVE